MKFDEYSHANAKDILLANHRQEYTQITNAVKSCSAAMSGSFKHGTKKGKSKLNTDFVKSHFKAKLSGWEPEQTLGILKNMNMEFEEDLSIHPDDVLSLKDATEIVNLQYKFSNLGGRYSISSNRLIQYLKNLGKENLLIRKSPRSRISIRKREFMQIDWNRVVCAMHLYGKRTDFVKNGVGVELQLAHYGLVYNDLNKFHKLWKYGYIDVAVEIVSQLTLRKEMSDNVGRFETLYHDLAAFGSRNDYPFPILVIGMDID